MVVDEMVLGSSHTDCGEFRPHMDNHDHRHDQSQNVHEVIRALEYNGVCQFDGSRVAVGLYASAGTVDG